MSIQMKNGLLRMGFILEKMNFKIDKLLNTDQNACYPHCVKKILQDRCQAFNVVILLKLQYVKWLTFNNFVIFQQKFSIKFAVGNLLAVLACVGVSKCQPHKTAAASTETGGLTMHLVLFERCFPPASSIGPLHASDF